MSTIPDAFSIALQHHQAGRLNEAEPIYRQILAADPNHHDAWHLLGVVAYQVGKHETGVECIQRALALKPIWADAHHNLGVVWKEQGKLDEAVACYQRALQLKADFAEAHNNLGIVWREQGKLDDARTCYQRALQLKPDYAEAHNNLGIIWREQGKLDDAIACYQQALQLKTDYAEAHNNLGIVWREQGKLDDAIACYQRALQLKPDYTAAHNNLATVWMAQRKLDEAVVGYHRTLQLKPDYTRAHDNLLCALQYRSGVTLSGLAAAHAEYDRLVAAPLRTAWRLHENDRDPHRRLRVGFVSPDFRRHPVGYFLIRILENLNSGECETICYSDLLIEDDLTRRFQAGVTIWRDVSCLSDNDLTEEIRADRIDILFDLAGHTDRNRLLVFARKPAPVQMTWAGYVGTTGLTAMDYILADRYEIPRDAEAHYCERVLRMSDGYVCYDPPGYAPPVSPLPALKQGYVTFGSFNNPVKITPHTVAVWAKVLDRVPQSRLVLKYRGLSDASIAKGLAEEFASHRVDPTRVALFGWSAHAISLAEYHRIDLALDPLPFNGGLTTCEALWMGVPVITCPGETFASRHSLSHLANVGLTETVARNESEYVELAVSFASDLPRLARLRSGLRERVAASPLCDGKRFVANLTAILRSVWREWTGDARGGR